MSVHVSLHLVSSAPADPPKVPESANSGESFSHALSVATDTAEPPAAQHVAGRDADKKQQKKPDDSKDASSSILSSQIPLVVQTAIPPAVAAPGVPTLPMPEPSSDPSVAVTVDSTGNARALSSSSNESVISRAGQRVGMQPVRVANPIVSTVATNSDTGTPVTHSEDDSNVAVSDGSGPQSGASLGRSDEAVALPPGSPSVLAGSSEAAPPTAPKDASAEQDRLGKTGLPTVPTDDVMEVATAWTPPPANPFAPQPVASAVQNVPDLTAMTASSKTPAVGNDDKTNNSKAGAAVSKDRANGDVRGRHKADDSDTGWQSSGFSVTAPGKPLVTTAASSHQGNEGQTASKDIVPAEAPPTAFMAPTSDAKPASQETTTTRASDPSSPPLPANGSVADGAATPTLSGARLVQSVHQSEMKLGMNSAEFGNISITTSVTHQALSAQISLDHSELGRALAAHLPAMEEKLGNAYGLQARVELRDGADASYSGSSQESGGSRHERRGGSTNATMFSNRLGAVATRSTSTSVVESARLDIRI